MSGTVSVGEDDLRRPGQIRPAAMTTGPRWGECGVYPDLLQLPSVGCLLFLQAFAQLGADLEETAHRSDNSASGGRRQ